jgi:predicted nucleotidyltransferase component of viral defense system
MAVLGQHHWEVIPDEMRKLLEFISRQECFTRFYLAGGTGLALQIGHRRSVDLDFFSEKDQVLWDTRQEILKAFSPLALQVIENVDGNLLLLVNGIQTGFFFSYGYPLLEPASTLDGIHLASIIDIALMKLDDLVRRGSRKDFYDVYMITRHIPLSELLRLGIEKYPQVRDFAFMVLEGMVMYENAERDRQPELCVDVSWEQVRSFYISQARKLADEWFMGE